MVSSIVYLGDYSVAEYNIFLVPFYFHTLHYVAVPRLCSFPTFCCLNSTTVDGFMPVSLCSGGWKSKHQQARFSSSFSPWLASGHSLSVSWQFSPWASLVFLFVSNVFSETYQSWWTGTWMALFLFNYLLKALSPNIGTSWGTWGQGSIMNLGEHNSAW